MPARHFINDILMKHNQQRRRPGGNLIKPKCRSDKFSFKKLTLTIKQPPGDRQSGSQAVSQSVRQSVIQSVCASSSRPASKLNTKTLPTFAGTFCLLCLYAFQQPFLCKYVHVCMCVCVSVCVYVCACMLFRSCTIFTFSL